MDLSVIMLSHNFAEKNSTLTTHPLRYGDFSALSLQIVHLFLNP